MALARREVPNLDFERRQFLSAGLLLAEESGQENAVWGERQVEGWQGVPRQTAWLLECLAIVKGNRSVSGPGGQGRAVPAEFERTNRRRHTLLKLAILSLGDVDQVDRAVGCRRRQSFAFRRQLGTRSIRKANYLLLFRHVVKGHFRGGNHDGAAVGGEAQAAGILVRI